MRFEIGFGIGFDREGKRIDVTQQIETQKLILAQAAMVFGGCNLIAGQGAWINGKGDLVVEESRVLVIDAHASQEDAAFKLAEFVRRVLNQEAVHVSRLDGIAVDVVATARGELVPV